MEFQLFRRDKRSNAPVAFLRICISLSARFFTISVLPSPFSCSREWTCWASHAYALPARGGGCHLETPLAILPRPERSRSANRVRVRQGSGQHECGFLSRHLPA